MSNHSKLRCKLQIIISWISYVSICKMDDIAQFIIMNIYAI